MNMNLNSFNFRYFTSINNISYWFLYLLSNYNRILYENFNLVGKNEFYV